MIGWAYGAEAGDVSNPFRIDGDYIIATLVRIKEAGVPPLENVEAQMRAGAIKDKKAEMYMDIMVGSSLEDVAEKAGDKVSTATGVSLKFPSISGAGSAPEPDVIGAAFALPLDVISEPIKGQRSRVIAPVTRNPVEATGTFTTEVAGLNDRTYFRNLPPAAAPGPPVLRHPGEGRGRGPAPGKLIPAFLTVRRLSACGGHSDRSRRQASP